MSFNLMRFKVEKFISKTKNKVEKLFRRDKESTKKATVRYNKDAPLPQDSETKKFNWRGRKTHTRRVLKKHPLHNMAFGNFHPIRPFTTGGIKTKFFWEK